jgi:predicted HAD superfamily Cof-like phosphohydrolase
MTQKEMTLQEAVHEVQRFHETFGLSVAGAPVAKLPPAVLELRLKLLQEELDEYRQAAEAGNLVAIADALTDILYVLFGTFVSHGLQDLATELFVEVQRSNMSKLDAAGQPIVRADGKILKSSQFSAPDLATIIARHLT